MNFPYFISTTLIILFGSLFMINFLKFVFTESKEETVKELLKLKSRCGRLNLLLFILICYRFNPYYSKDFNIFYFLAWELFGEFFGLYKIIVHPHREAGIALAMMLAIQIYIRNRNIYAVSDKFMQEVEE